MRDDARRNAAWLSAELEAKLLHRLGIEWRSINYTHFRSALRVPVISLVDGGGALARWCAELHSLELSRALVLASDWAEVLEAVKREMVLQFIDERMCVVERNRHSTFRRICRRLGIDPMPKSRGEGEESCPERQATDRIVSRIHKLLALASSPNRHEAETAAMTARRLMLKFNVEHSLLEQGAGPREYGFRHLGPRLGRLREHDQRLAKILTTYFFVETVWVPIYLPRRGARGHVLEVCGLEVNLLMAEHVHAFLRRTSSRLWSEYEQVAASSSLGDRLAFLAGVMQGFEAKLAAQHQRLEEEGLVWVPAPELDAYFRRRNPRLHGVGVGAGAHSVAWEEGSRAGRSITLSSPLGSGHSGGGRPKALGPGSFA